MATLIQSKQIQGVVTASVIEGIFTVSGSLVATDITASGNVRANTFTGNGGGLTNINFGSIVNAPTLVSGSSQIIGILTDLNTFSGSQNTKDLTLATYTASVTSQLSNLTQATSSFETKGRGIISSSAQISALGYVVGGGGTSDYTQLINVPNGIISGSAQITSLGFVSSSASVPTGTISGSSQITALGFVSSSTNISALNTFTSSIDTKFATLGSQTGSWGGGATIPTGTISSSAQITALGFVSSSASIPSGTISGSSQLTASYDTRYTLSGSVQPLPSNVVSGSSQISYTGLSNIPAGIISSSQQLPQGLVSGSSQILGGSGVISGSSQLTASYDSRYTLSGSIQNVILPSNLISSSAQITALGFVSGSYATSQSVAELVISSSLMTASIAGLRADVDSLASSGVPAGTISGSTQIQRAGFLLSSSFNSFTQSLATAITASGTNVTINGNLTVKGTTTTINSTTLQIGDNIIELNGSENYNGGLLVKDANGASKVSGSLLWDATNDWWKAGVLGSEAKILLVDGDSVVSGSSQISFTELSNLPSGIISSSDQITSSLDTKYVLSGSITQTTWDNIASKPDGIISGSSQITALGFISSSQTIVTSSLATTGSNTFFGTQVISGSLNVSGTINPDNVTVGIPTSNAWQSSLNGSYFNNFTSETNVSEILRFVAGLLSASAPDATPNTKTLASITANEVNTTSGTTLVGRIPQSSTNTTITYLNSKGFATAGSTIFSGITPIYTSNYGRTYTSVAGGTTIASSSADTQLFGLGTLSSGTATSFKVSGSFTYRFKDNSSKTDTTTSSSIVTLTQTGAGTSNGLSLALIPTANSAVIPAGYQDGKFSTAFSPYLYSGSANAVSASGYYHISASFQIASGSSGFSPVSTSNGSEIFWAPLTTISTNVPTQTPTLVVSAYVPLTATSRSLSGAPYLTGATYEISASVSGTFNPLFYNGTIAGITEVDSLVTSTGTSTVVTSGGTISTANAVYGIDNTLRSTSTIPYETDTIRLNSKFTFTPSTNENINQTGLGTTSFVATISGYNFTGTQTSTTSTILYHSGSTFGQPLSSGSMAYYGASQASDASATTLYEPFLGENYRIQLADNVLAFNGTAWTTSFGLYNLGIKDLQVKPGHLVKPGGTYAYWLGNPSTASDYKYYIRKFTTSGVKTSMTLNLGQTLNAWDSSADGPSAVILFESSKNTIYTPARVYDPTKTLSNFVSTISANTDGQNPFGSSIDLYGNTGGSLSSTTYTIPLRNGDGMFLNATYTNIYVIVRYKGDPTPITSITIA